MEQPKRLSDMHIAWMTTAKEHDVKMAALEIQERRAAEPKGDAIEQLRLLRDYLHDQAMEWQHEERETMEPALEAFDTLLRANGIDPEAKP